MRLSLRFWRTDTLSAEAEQVIRLLAAGGTLKAHRSVDGEKVARLHPLSGPSVDVSPAAMNQLKQNRLLDSNMKFPAATYLLTQKGKDLAAKLIGSNVRSTG
jgi:hypothetical protein